MIFQSRGTPEFWSMYHRLPRQVRILARKNYALWLDNPWHPSLHFKKVGGNKWSVRIGLDYRAIGEFDDEEFTWDWIGPHAEYDRLV